MNTLLQELIRYADSLLAGMSPNDKLDWLRNKDARDKLFEDKPECFLPLKKINEETFQPFFVICNRSGVVNTDMIASAIKLAKKLTNNETVDQIQLTKTLKKLIMLHKRYSGGPARPFKQAMLKRKSTMRLNDVINALQSQSR